MIPEEALDIVADIVWSDPYPHTSEKAELAVRVLKKALARLNELQERVAVEDGA